jgi:hypothetical protein
LWAGYCRESTLRSDLPRHEELHWSWQGRCLTALFIPLWRWIGTGPSRALALKSGERLRTLHDAASLLSKRFGHSAALEHTTARMLRAAEAGTRADCKAATEQVATVLRVNRVM